MLKLIRLWQVVYQSLWENLAVFFQNEAKAFNFIAGICNASNAGLASTPFMKI